jgi:hypothetical protein
MERDERKILRDSMMYADVVRVLWGVVQLQRLGVHLLGHRSNPSRWGVGWHGLKETWAECVRGKVASTGPKSLLVFQSVDLIEL